MHQQFQAACSSHSAQLLHFQGVDRIDSFPHPVKMSPHIMRNRPPKPSNAASCISQKATPCKSAAYQLQSSQQPGSADFSFCKDRADALRDLFKATQQVRGTAEISLQFLLAPSPVLNPLNHTPLGQANAARMLQAPVAREPWT